MKKKSRVKHAVAFGPACTCQIISLAPPLSLTLPPPPYAHLLHFIVLAMVDAVAEPGLSRTPGRVLSIDVHKLTVQKIHENINGKIANIQKAPSRSNIFILLQQLIQVLLQQLIQVQR